MRQQDVTSSFGDLFEENRPQLRAVAYRMLGSLGEADDAVQEAWLRFSRSDSEEIENLGGWLKTVVARVCLDMLRSRKSRREESLDAKVLEPVASQGIDPEQEAIMADSVGLALLIVLETLAPAERVAFVLHDMFDIPFEEIGPIVGRSSTATRQLASRARRRVKGTDKAPSGDLRRQRELVKAFKTAATNGDLEALIALLTPDAVVRADQTAVRFGAEAEVRGAAAVARTFLGRAQAARHVLVDGTAGLVWQRSDGRPNVVFNFTFADGKISAIDLVGNQETIDQIDLKIIEE